MATGLWLTSDDARLPNALSYEDGALLEPLSVCIHSVNRAGVKDGARCLVFGAGAVGLLCAAVAKIEHKAQIVITDIDEGRVAFAIEHGFADLGFVVVPRKAEVIDSRLSVAKDLAMEIGKLKWPGGEEVDRVDHVFECTGVESCVQSSIFVSYHFNTQPQLETNPIIGNSKWRQHCACRNGNRHPNMANCRADEPRN